MNKVLPGDIPPSHPSAFKRLRASLLWWRRVKHQPETALRMCLSDIQDAMELSLQGLSGAAAQHLRQEIRSIRDARELWLLRSMLHQIISMQVNQQAASQAINAMLPCFAGWVPAKQLVEI